MKMFLTRCILLSSIALAMLLDVEAMAGTYIDSQNLAALTVSSVPSTTVGHIAWQFGVMPLDSANEVSSIDVATGTFGFSGDAFRQVNPQEQPTVFADFNAFFGEGEDETTDTQFTYDRSSLIVVPGSELESDTQLEAAFTSFPPMRFDDGSVTFAQVVAPVSATGQFRGAFAVRSVSGGLAQFVEFGPISFRLAAADFDFDGDVDAADLVVWGSSYGIDVGADADSDGDSDGADFLAWQQQFGPGAPGQVSAQIVPEPTTIALFLMATIALLLLPTKR